jgi:hypothetical protein
MQHMDNLQPHQQALLDAIRQFKPPETSDVQALLNCIDNHAWIIKSQQAKIDKLETGIANLIVALEALKD